MKTQIINGELFEIIKPRKYKPEFVKPNKWDYLEIYEAYETPSKYKVDIWREWVEFCNTCAEIYRFDTPFISSRNTWNFAITVNVFDANTLEWVGVAHITKDHNRIYLA